MKKYEVHYISGVPFGVGVKTKTMGGVYTELICECFLPSDKLSEKEQKAFMKEQEDNMKLIANALNAYKQ